MAMKQMRRTTLCTATRTTAQGRWEVLLGEELSGLGTGRTVVIGGHPDPGEDPEEAAVREPSPRHGCTDRDGGIVRGR
ncbi:NUDIX domain-containing protein [Streptomyces sp. NPDC054863]